MSAVAPAHGLLAACGPARPPVLQSHLDGGGLAGLRRAAGMSAQEIVLVLRAAGLRRGRGSCAPVFQDWWRLTRVDESPVLVVDFRCPDPLDQAPAALLAGDPFGLVEALAIAGLALGSTRVRMVSGRQSFAQQAFLQMALDQFRAAPPLGPATPSLELEFLSAQAPDRESAPVAQEPPSLIHDLQTWYQVALVFRLGAEAYRALGRGDQAGTRLLTVLAPGSPPRLVELAMGAPLGEALGLEKGQAPSDGWLGLALDGGLAGFLSPPASATPLAPEELMAAGVHPGLATITRLGPEACVVDLTRRALTRQLRAPEDASLPAGTARQLSQHALRLVIEIGQRRGKTGYLEQLLALGKRLRGLDAPTAWPLVSSLTHFGPAWQAHLAGEGCPAYDADCPHLAPCQGICPAGIDIPSFLALVGHGRHAEALAVIRQDNPLPYICGLVCPAPCEIGCLRGDLDQPIAIRVMKAVAAAGALAAGGYPKPEIDPPSGQRVAVIGAGPAGLACAWFAALKGHAVTVFEAQDQVGGTTFMGIPAYRLPREVIAADVQGITDIGVEIRPGQDLGRDFSLQDLRDQGFDAVFLGIGAMRGYLLGIPGEAEHPQVLDAVSFLRAVSQGDHRPPAERVVVVGGGNAAMDAARTCLRLGVKEVTLAYRRTREEMPAHDEEVREAQAEGVNMRFLTVPIAVEGTDGRVTGLRCLKAQLGPPDDSGRRRPVPVEGSDFVIAAGAVIAAIGQQPDLSCLGDLAGQASLAGRTLKTHPVSGQTALPWLFAGGDAVTGPRTVVEAVAAGKRAAQGLDAFLRGQDPVAAVQRPRPRQRVEPLTLSALDKANLGRASIPQRPAAQRRHDFDQVELPLPLVGALREARRCLRCDLCIGCGLCQTACAEAGVGVLSLSPTAADRLAFLDLTGPGAECIGCGSCANACPTGALQVLDQGATRRLALAGAVFAKLDLVPCSTCGRYYAPQAYLRRVEGRLDASHAPISAAGQHICPECSRLKRAAGRWAEVPSRAMPGLRVRPPGLP